MTAITESTQNEEQPGALPQEELKRREGSGEDILSGANQTDQLDRLHPDAPKNREEVGSPPVEHVEDGSPQDISDEGNKDAEGGSQNAL